MIQVAELHPLAQPTTRYFPEDDTLDLTHSERMRLYTTAPFDLACFAFLIGLLLLALFV